MRHSAALLAAAAAACAGLVPAAPAVAAARPTHVAIVIGGHGVACVPWHSGITGDEILNDVATVKYRPTDGLITQIDGTPKNNRADETHYWSYWHNTGAGWKYSSVGAGSYKPAAGTVEGWHFVNGSSTATPPPVRSYASICHDTVVSVPVPPPATSSSKQAPSTAASRASTPRSPVVTPTSGGSSSSSTRPASTPSGSASGSPTAPASVAASSATPPPAGVASADALATLRVHPAADATPSADQGSMLPTVLVGIVVVLLGGGAALATRRRRRTP